MSNHLLVHSIDAHKYEQLLRRVDLPDLDITICDSPDQAEKVADACNMMLGEPALITDLLQHARNLAWVQSTFAGVELFCREGLRRDYILTGIKGVHDPLISEYVLAYILALERHLFETRDNQTAGIWSDIPYRSLRSLTLGICGLGSIGRHLAKTARQFGMHVLAYKRTPGRCADVEKIYTGDALGDLLKRVDYLVLTLPNTPATTGFINKGSLSQLKPSAVLINVGRGNAVVENDIIAALQSNRLRAAILDVFENEPLPPQSPLWKIPNAMITPHNAAYSFPEDVAGIFHRNYLRFIQQKPLDFVIDFERGY